MSTSDSTKMPSITMRAQFHNLHRGIRKFKNPRGGDVTGGPRGLAPA
jgi:hypothetical protein